MTPKDEEKSKVSMPVVKTAKDPVCRQSDCGKTWCGKSKNDTSHLNAESQLEKIKPIRLKEKHMYTKTQTLMRMGKTKGGK